MSAPGESLLVPDAAEPPPRPGRPEPGVVHVWQASLDAGDTTAELSLLSRDERERASRFHTPRLTSRFVRSRALLRTILGRYLATLPEALRFADGAEGKPFLAEPADTFRFNLSHSGSLWALAVSTDREVGIDVERITRRLDVPGVARRMFAPGEHHAVLSLPEELRNEAFFRCWASREAIVKGMGAGMFSLRERFEIDVDPRRPLGVRTSAEGFPWRIGLVPVGGEAVGVLAVEGEPVAIKSWFAGR